MKQDMNEAILIRYILGDATAAEVEEIEHWITISSKNAAELEKIKIILETSNKMAQVSPLSETEAWERFKNKRNAVKGQPAKVISLKSNTRWLRIAAAVLFLIGSGVGVFYLYNVPKEATSEWVNIKATNKVLTDTLPDGSIVHVNKNSSIAYNGNFKMQRVVRLKGEAFFSIKHNAALPFAVHVNDISIVDIGTAFNVKSKNDFTEIRVESGVVGVSKNNNGIQLRAHEMTSIRPGDKDFKIEKSDDLLYNYYVSNTFIAVKTPLKRLIDVLNEAYNADIKIENTALLKIPITVTIRFKDSLPHILDLIKETTPGMQVDSSSSKTIIR